MIQRIQTVYLALAALALGVFALVGFVPDTDVVASPEWPGWLAALSRILAGLAAAGAVWSIFRYADRTEQRTLVARLQWLVIASVVAQVIVMYLFPEVLGFEERGLPALLVLLPLIGYALLMLARRAVDRDIALVKSMDRLR
jgi:predicted membrane protein